MSITIKRGTATTQVLPSDKDVLAAAVEQTAEAIPLGEAIRTLRLIAHKYDLVVEGPCTLRKLELTSFGKSDNPVYAHARYEIRGNDDVLAGLRLTPDDQAAIKRLVPSLLHRGDVNVHGPFKNAKEFAIDDVVGASQADKALWHDNKGMWTLTNGTTTVGQIIRIGDGSEKHYILFLRYEDGFHQMVGAPLFDVPLFNAKDLMDRPDAPVMIHEGPKSASGARYVCSIYDEALKKAQKKNRPALFPPLNGLNKNFVSWLNLYVHVGWHGSDQGIPWTDWSPLRGRRVLIWPDMDHVGITNARSISRRLARMGNLVSYIDWEDHLLEEGWDLADDGALMPWLSRSEVKRRLKMVESPFNNRKQVLPEWLRRSFVDENEAEVYQVSTNYRPLKKMAIDNRYGRNSWRKIVDSHFNEYVGSTFIPGERMGKVAGGLINVCPPSLREPCRPTPLKFAIWRALTGTGLNPKWLRKAIPDYRQRKYLLRRIILAWVLPQRVPQSAVVLQGQSGSGKSLTMNVICHVAGMDRAVFAAPQDYLGNFNAKIDHKSIVCVPEIHGSELNRVETTRKQKELIANEHISVTRKGKDAETRKNVIHWFMATNEAIPIDLREGNNRYYFVKMEAPQDAGELAEHNAFMKEWYGRLTNDSGLHDLFYAAAKHIAGQWGEDRILSLIQRPEIQNPEDAYEAMSVWQQYLKSAMDDFEAAVNEKGESYEYFVARGLFWKAGRLSPGKNPPGLANIRGFMKRQGYAPLSRKKDGKLEKIRQTVIEGDRVAVWGRSGDYERLLTEGGQLVPTSLVYQPDLKD